MLRRIVTVANHILAPQSNIVTKQHITRTHNTHKLFPKKERKKEQSGNMFRLTLDASIREVQGLAVSSCERSLASTLLLSWASLVRYTHVQTNAKLRKRTDTNKEKKNNIEAKIKKNIKKNMLQLTKRGKKKNEGIRGTNTWYENKERIKKAQKCNKKRAKVAAYRGCALCHSGGGSFPILNTFFYLFWRRILPRSGGRSAWGGCSRLGRPLLLRQQRRTRNHR